MSSGSKGGRSNKGSRGRTEKTTGGTSTQNSNKADHNHNENDKDTVHTKIAPTADQLRIAQMINNKHSESDSLIQEKMNQVMQITGVGSDDAIVALHDCDNDVTAAIDSLLEGDGQGEWMESSAKKKKKTSTPKVSITKEESEGNKENRRVDNRERSSSRPSRGSGPPRFRGRGGGGGGRNNNKDEEVGVGRGGFRRRGMPNGTAPVSRGRGARGRGSSSMNSRTFQKRQPPGFTEKIDTWGVPSPEKMDNSANSLQIDNWDEEKSGTTEDWDSEWTGSLDKTTVFGSSSNPGVSPKVPEGVTNHNSGDAISAMGSGILSLGQSSQLNSSPQSYSSAGQGIPQSPYSSGGASQPPTGGSYSTGGQQPPQSVGSYSSGVAPPTQPNIDGTSMSQSQANDFVALLQKAAPHSTLGRLPPVIVDGSLRNSSLNNESKTNILSEMQQVPVPDSLKSGVQPSPTSQTYSSSASINNSMFSNSVSNLGSSLSTGNKVLGLTSQSSSLAARSKPPARRLPSGSSKIPSSAVVMPQDAMSALNMQFTGLEFGTETFDFGSDGKSPESAKDLSSLNAALSQSQSLGPQPIPFPTQASERKSASNMLASNNARPSASVLSELSKKDGGKSAANSSAAAASSLSALVGSNSGYQNSPSSIAPGYGPSKSANSFPSPPTAHYPNSQQNYSNSSGSGVSNSNYVGSNNASGNNNSGGSSVYGSSFSVQASANSGQYQNSYVNSSSHSLASISVPKTQTLSGLKDTSQSYNDSVVTTGSLNSSLASSAAAGGSGASGLQSSVSSSSVQSPKSSVPGNKSVSSLGSSVPPGVGQSHSGSSSQQQQSHMMSSSSSNINSAGSSSSQQQQHQQINQHHQPHHLQQQVTAQPTQQTQLMAGPSQYTVSPQAAALQGAIPPPFYNMQQTPMYSYEDLQMFQQRMPHMQSAPTTLTGGRDGNITAPASYSVADAAKFRTDQNSSPVPSTITQQAAAAAGTYITATQNATLPPPFYMYQTMPPVASNFPQYGTPAIIQIPPNTHTGSTNSQFAGPPKLPYGGSSTYYDSMAQTQDYKTGYGSGSQGQNKAGPNSTGSASNSGSDLSGFKNHLSKVTRTYDKPGFHTGNPAAQFGIQANSGTNYAPMFIPTMQAAQHHSPQMHHLLQHQQESNSPGQRSATGGAQNKGGTKPFAGSYWGS